MNLPYVTNVHYVRNFTDVVGSLLDAFDILISFETAFYIIDIGNQNQFTCQPTDKINYNLTFSLLRYE